MGQQAAGAGHPVLVGAGAVAHGHVGGVQEVPDALGGGEVGQVSGAAGHGVVQQERGSGRAHLQNGHGGHVQVVGVAPQDVPETEP